MRLRNRLKPEGKIISSKNGENVSNVEFSDLLVGGYIVIEADDYDTAVSKLKAFRFWRTAVQRRFVRYCPWQAITP